MIEKVLYGKIKLVYNVRVADSADYVSTVFYVILCVANEFLMPQYDMK